MEVKGIEEKTIYHFPKAVAIVVFNRLDCVQKQMEILKCVTPPRLYIISDGPRKEVKDDKKKVYEVRKYIEENIDWECKLIRIYADENMGCSPRTVSGYDEVFKHEEEAVLIEDDSVPCIDFYRYMELMLDFYRTEHKIMMVSGFNLASDYIAEGRKDYYFSHLPVGLAWGTWRRAWKLFDTKEMKDYRNWDDRFLYKILPKRVANMMRCRILDNYNGWRPWDSKWNFLMFYYKGYGVVSAINYVQNIGSGREDATHPGEYDASLMPSYGKFPENFSYRRDIEWDKEYDFYQANVRFPEGCDKGWKRAYIKGNLLRFTKKYFPVWLYIFISKLKRKIIVLKKNKE